MGRRNLAKGNRPSHFTRWRLGWLRLFWFLLFACEFTVSTMPADHKHEVAGAVFGSGYSKLCSEPLEIPAGVGSSGDVSFPTPPRSDEKHGTSLKAHPSTVPSFTFCAFLRVHKSRPHSPIFTYFGRSWTVTAGKNTKAREIYLTLRIGF